MAEENTHHWYFFPLHFQREKNALLRWLFQWQWDCRIKNNKKNEKNKENQQQQQWVSVSIFGWLFEIEFKRV